MNSSPQKTSRIAGLNISAEELRKYRRSRHESQGLFWARFGVTQSRGSRFEKGAEIPKPVAILLQLYINGILTDGDLTEGMFVPRAGIAASKRILALQRAH